MISLIVVLEIFSNPHDLSISIAQDKDSKKWALLFCRGPGHGFKPLFESKFSFENSESVIGYIKEILDTIQKSVREDFEKREGLVFQILNPLSEKLDESRILNDEVITRIIKDLKEKNFAATFKNPT